MCDAKLSRWWLTTHSLTSAAQHTRHATACSQPDCPRTAIPRECIMQRDLMHNARQRSRRSRGCCELARWALVHERDECHT
jgi:hypothetical protein